jgi:hypothetical protein
MRFYVLSAALILGLIGVKSASAQPKFPFTLPTLDGAPTTVDVSALNSAPAGKAGFVRVQGEHFVDGNGQKIRFWGVNVNYAGAFPPKDIAPRVAARLAKFGFNSVRLHQFETTEGSGVSSSTIFKVGTNSRGLPEVTWPLEIDPVQLDRFDFFVAELIKRGIYINLNLHVARKVRDQDGFVYSNLLPEKDKGIAYFDSRLEEKNKEFTRELLNHVNPYLGRAYKDEPGLCAIEVDNENSLLSLWLEGTISEGGRRPLPDYYADRLRASWNDWLRQKYASEGSFRRAWTESNTPLSGTELLLSDRAVSRVAPATPPVSSMQTAEDGSVIIPQTAPGANISGREVRESNPAANLEARVPTLTHWNLATTPGAVGKAELDEFAGPSLNGVVQPGLSVRIDRQGQHAWAFQLVREGLNLESQKNYTFSFWARSDQRRTISFNVWDTRRPYNWLGVTRKITLDNDWKQYTIGFRPVGAVPPNVRLALDLGNNTGLLQFGDFSLRAGGRIGLPDEWGLRAGVPLINAKDEPLFAARRDFARFLGDVEARYVKAQRDFLKNELGVKTPIWHTQANFGGWGGVRRESLSDVTDLHVYWKHPNGLGTPNWSVENASMTQNPLDDPLAAFALSRTSGKPLVVTEWNSGQPNDFSSETLLMAAAYASQQDFAGIWLFDYHSFGPFDRDKFDGPFAIDSHTGKMATAPLASILYRRSDMAVSPITTTLYLSPDKQWDEVANAPLPPFSGAFLKTWSAAGGTPASYLPGRTSVLRSPIEAINGRTNVSEEQSVFPTTSLATLANPQTFFSSTGETVRDGTRDLWKVNTARTKVWSGFWGGRRLRVGELDAWFDSSNPFHTGALSSLDGLPIRESRRMLMVLCGKVENTGMVWNAKRNAVSNWGTGPTIVWFPEATIKVGINASDLKVYALDNTGQRKAIVPSTYRNGQIKFRATQQYQTVWFEIAP